MVIKVTGYGIVHIFASYGIFVSSNSLLRSGRVVLPTFLSHGHFNMWTTFFCTACSVSVKFPNTTCIIDCSERVLQKPRNLHSRGKSYCHYYYITVKYLVAVGPCEHMENDAVKNS